jgi:N-acetylglucosamine-6-sulfatase
MSRLIAVLILMLFLPPAALADSPEAPQPREGGAASQPNIIFILCDDHRWDALSAMGHPFLETPHLDAMIRNGVHFSHAFVTNSLCSPSRASILTGLYPHNHGVGDNYHPVDPSLRFFPEDLQDAGYETAFIGKWHMGDVDDPQRGFDHWVAFRGQGTYYADGHGTTRMVPQTTYDGFNINGKERVPQRGYITDELTDYALDWLDNRKQPEKPFFVYISHKAVHSDFVARDGQRGMYKDKAWEPPVTFANTEENRHGKPRWLIDQRNSRHGVDFGYNLDNFDLDAYHKRYCEALTAVDDNVGRVMDYLKETDNFEDTIVVYMGDNGFQFGEQGLIDKRVAYEASIRVPLIIQYPEQLQRGRTVEQIVTNIDIAPTLLEAAGAKSSEMDGASFWDMALEDSEAVASTWRNALLYEYYWEWNYPQTPTMFAIRDQDYKYIRYHGIWDTDELYDMRADPHEQHNLIRSQEHQQIASELRSRMFRMLEESDGLRMPLQPERGRQFYYRNPNRAAPGSFPDWFYERPAPVTK